MAKLLIRPVCSHHLKLCGSDFSRLVSIRGAQNASWSFTSVNGTAESLRCSGAFGRPQTRDRNSKVKRMAARIMASLGQDPRPMTLTYRRSTNRPLNRH